MPIFDYTCADCGQTSELLVRGSQDQPACPRCGSAKLEKQLPVVAVKGLKSDHVHSNGCGCGKPRGGCGSN
jgi:putative FmdB family regulatory protein